MATQASDQVSATGPITMDSRRFLGAINSSLQARVAHVEALVRDLGKRVGANWRLAALRNDSLFIEDIDSHDYYLAAQRREKGGRLVIENVRPIKIIENKKRSLFEQSCIQLIAAIEENDQKGMAVAYNKMIGQRFSARTIPLTGRVRTQDGVIRTVLVAQDELLGEDIRRRLVAAIIEGISDQVVVREGRVVSATFNDTNFKLPISEWTCRKAVARQMRQIAENAYWSKGFQDRTYAVARLINEDKVVDAVRLVSGFLAENQEFTLLNRKQLQLLIENAMATKAIFNQQLCNDTAQLFWRTNLKINRRSIIDEWRTTAKKAAQSTLLENVRKLEEAKNFEQAYETFINMVFNEAIGPREIQVDAYKTALKALKETPKVKGASELSGKIDELIERLDQPEADHAVIAEVEDLLAEVKNEMNALQNLDNFDQMPGGMNQQPGGDDGLDELLGGEAGAAGGKGGTTVNFNINIGGEGVTTGGGEEEGGDIADLLGGDEEEEGGDDLAALLGGGAGGGGGGIGGGGGGGIGGGGAQLAGGKRPMMQGRERGRAVTENLPPGRRPWQDNSERADANGDKKCPECGHEFDGRDCPKCGYDREGTAHDRLNSTESVNADPYAFNEGERRPVAQTGVGGDYGLKPIQIHEDCVRCVRAMFNLIAKHKLAGQNIGENLEKLAVAGMQAAGLRVPTNRRDAAVLQVCEVFADECNRRVALGEDQYKWDWAYKGGRRRATYNKPTKPRKMTAVTSEGSPGGSAVQSGVNKGLQWLRVESDGVLGEMGGVRFIFDHGGDSQLEPVILSEDGQVEVPIPADLYDSAFAAARMADGDPKPFLDWLIANLAQLRPISETEQRSLDEAVVTISTAPSGEVEIQVDSEEGISFGDEGEGEVISEPGAEGAPGEVGDDLAAGAMEPVETVPGAAEEGEDELPVEAGAHEMPDFEGGAPVEEGPPEEEEEGRPGARGPGARGRGGAGGGIGDIPGVGDVGKAVGAVTGELGSVTGLGGTKGPPATQEGGEQGEEEGAPSGAKGPDEEEVAEDHDVTSPQSTKYTSQALHSNPRKMPEHEPAPKGNDQLEGFSTGGGTQGTDAGTGAAKLKKVTPRGGKGGGGKSKSKK
jgi:hypothetical protein